MLMVLSDRRLTWRGEQFNECQVVTTELLHWSQDQLGSGPLSIVHCHWEMLQYYQSKNWPDSYCRLVPQWAGPLSSPSVSSRMKWWGRVAGRQLWIGRGWKLSRVFSKEISPCSTASAHTSNPPLDAGTLKLGLTGRRSLGKTRCLSWLCTENIDNNLSIF